jgi:hypothetical protein
MGLLGLQLSMATGADGRHARLRVEREFKRGRARIRLRREEEPLVRALPRKVARCPRATLATVHQIRLVLSICLMLLLISIKRHALVPCLQILDCLREPRQESVLESVLAFSVPVPQLRSAFGNVVARPNKVPLRRLLAYGALFDYGVKLWGVPVLERYITTSTR